MRMAQQEMMCELRCTLIWASDSFLSKCSFVAICPFETSKNDLTSK